MARKLVGPQTSHKLMQICTNEGIHFECFRVFSVQRPSITTACARCLQGGAVHVFASESPPLCLEETRWQTHADLFFHHRLVDSSPLLTSLVLRLLDPFLHYHPGVSSTPFFITEIVNPPISGPLLSRQVWLIEESLPAGEGTSTRTWH